MLKYLSFRTHSVAHTLSLENKLPHLPECATVNSAVTFSLDVAVGYQLRSDILIVYCENLCQL